MELLVAIVEDEEEFRKKVCNYLQKWENHTGYQYEVETKEYDSGKKFLNANQRFDIIFLDIELEKPGYGIQVAKLLRKQGDETPIVFLTSHKESVFVGYRVHALNFITKPIEEEDIYWCMNYVAKQAKKQYFVAETSKDSLRIPYYEILYIESERHYVKIVTDSQTHIFLSSLKKIMACLPEEFVQCHRSFIINLNRVQAIRREYAEFGNNINVEISERHRETVREIFLKQLHWEKGSK